MEHSQNENKRIHFHTNYGNQIIFLHFVNLCMLFQSPKIARHEVIETKKLSDTWFERISIMDESEKEPVPTAMILAFVRQ